MKHLFLFITGFLLCGLISAQSASPREFLPPFNFSVDSVSLLGTWEAPKIVLLDEDFEGEMFPPAGWAASSLGVGWQGVEDPDFWFWQFPVPGGNFALTNDDLIYSNNGSLDYLIMPSLDLTVADSFYLVFDSYFDGGYGQQAFIEYSPDNGTTWHLLHQIDASLEWEKIRVDLSEFSGAEGESNILISFHADDNGYFASGWAIDNVMIFSDENPQQVSKYKLFLDSNIIAIVDDGPFQYSLKFDSSYSCGILAWYLWGVSDTIWQNVHAWQLPKPDSLTGIVPDNTAILSWAPPLVPDQGPETGISRDVGDVILSFPAPSPISSCYGICDDGNFLWISDPTVSSDQIYKITYDAEYTGETITINLGQAWIGDMVSNGDFLFAILVGGPNSIVVVDLATGSIEGQITGDFSICPQMGLAADFVHDEFYVGGWDGNRIWRTNFDGETISSFLFNNVSGLAWEPDGGPDEDGSLWIMTNEVNNRLTEVKPDWNWAIMQYANLPSGMPPNSGAGIEISTNPEVEPGALWFCSQEENDILLLDLEEPCCPPIDWIIPENLLGFNIYKNNVKIDFVECSEANCCTFTDPVEMTDGVIQYEVSALYDLTPYGYPSDTGESQLDGPVTVSSCCFNTINFFEDWSNGWSGNYWKPVSPNWKIAEDFGNAAPAVIFNPDSPLVDYRDSLQTLMFVNEYVPIDMTFTFDVLLSSVTASGNEKLLVQVNDYSNSEWTTIRIYDNSAGSFGWISETVNPNGYFAHDAFRIRFLAEGENSADISYWAVDNIALTRICTTPRYLGAYIIDPEEDTILVNWSEPMPPLAEWMQWDDGEHDGSIGWGDGKESWHSIAAHWTPTLLQDINGAALTKIGFIPSDPRAFFKVAVWTGENTAPVYVQATGNLVLDEYNIIQLEEPLIIDVTKDLYVGYLVSAYTGYPASVDDGPAIDGFGNMTQGGNPLEWETLLEINPDLDYNWNIKAFFERDGVPFEGIYRVSRSIDDNEPEVIAETTVNEYYDSVEGAMGLYCYTVTCMFGDTCIYTESHSESCVVLTQTPSLDPEMDELIKIYPNPASDVLFIESKERIVSLTIFDSRGEEVKRRQGDKERMEISVRDLAPGLYLVKVETGSNVIKRKIIIKH